MKALALIIPFLLAPACFAQTGEITGRVVSSESEEPLVGASISLLGTLRGTITDAGGRFVLSNVPIGTHGVSVTFIGYEREIVRDVTVVEGQPADIRVGLRPAPVQGEPIVVTASKREQILRDVPASISLMDGRSISEHQFPTVEDALRYVPGVNLVESQVSIRGSSGYSRGAGSRVLLLVDGIPLLTGDTGELNFETLPVGQVDRIEVSKGAGSALYGSNALGGVINVLTKPIPAEPETRVRMYGGVYSAPSYDAWDWGGGTRFLDGVQFEHGRTIGNTGVLLQGSSIGDEGYRQNDYRRRYNAYAKLRQEFSSQDALTATFNILNQKRGSFINWKDLENALIPPDLQQGDWIESTRFFISSQYQHVASEKFMTVFRAMWFSNRFDDNIDTVTHRSQSDVLRGEGQVTWSLTEGNILIFGLDGSLEKVDADLFGERVGGGGALYAQDEFKLGEMIDVTLGARFDVHDVDSLEAESQLSPKAGLLYSPAEGTRLRASFGRGFRSPSVAEAFVTTSISLVTLIPNPALKSERSYSYEIGINQALGRTAMIDVALFQNNFANMIEPRFVSGTTAQFVNVTESRIRGIETNLNAALLSGALSLGATYTYIDPKDITADDVLKYRHRHTIYLNAVYRTGILMFGADYRYLSRMERIDDEFKVLIPDAESRVSISVLDLRAGVNVSIGSVPVMLLVNVKNLLQYNYVELIGNMAAPRSYVLTVEGVF